MRKNIIMALALAVPMASVAVPAMALQTSRTYTVNVEGNRAGQWKLRNRVVDNGDRCTYTVQWTGPNGPPLDRTVLCRIDETKASDNFDCETARHGSFDTLVQKAGGTCQGFDEFGSVTNIDTLIGGETSGGQINGIFVAASVGDVQTLSVN